jgi:DNA replication ATP-dependent helicase Dna2
MQIGELLRDWRRINVSFTRAKKKLVIFGSARTLSSDAMLKGFLDLMEDKRWVVKLPPGADRLHRGIFGMVGKEEKDGGEVACAKKSVKREGNVGKGVLNGRPFLKEAIEVSMAVSRITQPE